MKTFLAWFVSAIIKLVWRVPNKFRFAFVVYPGRREDLDNFIPPIFQGILLKIGWIFPFGPIRFNGKYGLIIAALKYDQQFERFPKFMLELKKHLIRYYPNIKSFAFAGRIPGIALKHEKNSDMGQGKDSVPNIGDNPFVKGNLGTRSAMRRVLRAAIQKIELSPERGVIAIIGGAGHTGKNIVLDAVRLKAAQTVIAFDPQYDTTKVETLDGVNVVYTADKQVLNGADLVMIFTRSGDDIRGLQGCFKKGALLVDDTHPYCSASVRKLFPGVTFLKAMLTVEGFSFLTGLPGFKGKGVPGCLFEALVYLEYEQAWGGSIDLETFDSFADRLNPEAMLIEHPR